MRASGVSAINCRFIAASFVEQENLRVADKGAAHRDALALAARELRGLAIEQILEMEDPRHFRDCGSLLLAGHAANLHAEA